MFCACEKDVLYFENLAKLQKRIYSDACDVGYVYDDYEAKELSKSLKSLMDVYNYNYSKWGDIYKGPGGFKVSMFIGLEREENEYIGMKLSISCNKDPNRKINYVFIDIKGGVYSDVSGYKE